MVPGCVACEPVGVASGHKGQPRGVTSGPRGVAGGHTDQPRGCGWG